MPFANKLTDKLTKELSERHTGSDEQVVLLVEALRHVCATDFRIADSVEEFIRERDSAGTVETKLQDRVSA